MDNDALHTCQTHAGVGVDVIADKIHFHRNRLLAEFTKDHKGNDQSVKCDTFCHSYEDNGFTETGNRLR